MPFSTREPHQVSVEPMIPPQMLYQGSHSLVGRSPLGHSTHMYQSCLQDSNWSALQHQGAQGAQGVSDQTKVQPSTQHPPPHLAPEQTGEQPGTAQHITVSPYHLPCIP